MNKEIREIEKRQRKADELLQPVFHYTHDVRYLLDLVEEIGEALNITGLPEFHNSPRNPVTAEESEAMELLLDLQNYYQE